MSRVCLFRHSFLSLCLYGLSIWLLPTARSAPAESDVKQPPRYWIWLRNQPQQEILERWEQTEGGPRAWAEQRLELLIRFGGKIRETELEQRRAAWAASLRAARERAFGEIERQIRPEQEAVSSLVEKLGGKVVKKYSLWNLLVAELAEEPGEVLARHPLVAKVHREPPPVKLETAPVEEPPRERLGAGRLSAAEHTQTTPRDPAGLSMGAGPLWQRGLIGRGEWVAILDSGVNVGHPMFRGLQVEGRTFLTRGSRDPGFRDVLDWQVDRVGSGTAAASLIAGQGAPGGWEQYKGVAWGVSGLLVLKCGYLRQSDERLEISLFFEDLLEAFEWLVRHRPDVKVVYALPLSFLEYFAASSGIFMPVRSGSVLEESRLSQPSRTREVLDWEGGQASLLTTAAINTKGTADRGDDEVSRYSARGPASDGRRKPDVAAPGTGFWFARHDSDGMREIPTATASAAAALAGAGALLRQAGVRDPLALKALLINTARGVETWREDWGWGAVDLERAYAEREQVIGERIPHNRALFYLGSARGRFTATLAWQRAIAAYPTPAEHDRPLAGCLADLDLSAYRESGGLLAASIGTIDSVERVSTSATGAVLLKVRYKGSPCRNIEPFALAVSEPGFRAVSGPSLTVSCAPPARVPVGVNFTLSCTVRNTGELPAGGVRVSLELPVGSTTTEINLGEIPAGQSAQASWSVRAPAAAGPFNGRATVSATAFEESFTASTAVALTAVAAGADTGPVFHLDPSRLSLEARAEDAPIRRQVRISNAGTGALAWRAASNQPWLRLSTADGSAPSNVEITILPGLLAAQRNIGTVTFSAAGAVSQSLVVVVQLIGPPSTAPVVTEVLSDGSFLPEFAPGAWVAIKGVRLASGDPRIWRAEEIVGDRLPVELDGVRVNIGGRPAAIYYVSPTQLNVQAPDDDAEGEVEVEVITPAGRSRATGVRRRWAPAVFTFQAGERLFVAALHNADYVLVAPENAFAGYLTRPARSGDVLQLYVTGLGTNTDPPAPSGRTLASPATVRDEVRVWIGEREAAVLWAGLVSPGLYQINLRVPAALEAGEHTVDLQVGGSARIRSQGRLPVAP